MSLHFNSTNPLGPKHTKSQIWLTPKWIIDALGGYEVFDLDVCGHLPEGQPIIQTAKQYYTEKEDGLIQKWQGMIFCNFPYNNAKAWMDKCRKEYNDGNCEIVVLCFNRSDTKWYQNNVKYATGTNCIKGRIAFLNENGKDNGCANAASILIAFGESAYKLIKKVNGIYARIDK